MSRNLMCIVPASYEELGEKGVTSHIFQRDLGGFWDKVITIHPFCEEYRIIKIKSHLIYEFPARDVLKTMRELPKIAKKYKVSAVKAHDPYWTAVIAMVVAKVCRIPFTIGIYASYELMWKVEKRWANGIIKSRLFDKILARLMFKLADKVQPGSLDAMKWAIKSGASPKKTRLVRTGGVNELHFEELDKRTDIRQENEELSGKYIVVAPGRLVPVRTPEDTIKAFINMLIYNQDGLLYIIGDGPLRCEMEKIAEQYGIEDIVKFLGFVHQRELRDWLYTADVILMPLGGSGLVEACLSGTPVVAYDVDWHNEIIIDGITGRLVPYRKYAVMALAAISILQAPKAGRLMGEAARAKALEQHSLSKVQGNEAKFFEELIKEK